MIGSSMVRSSHHDMTLVNFSIFMPYYRDVWEWFNMNKCVTIEEIAYTFLELNFAKTFKNTLPMSWRPKIKGTFFVCNEVLCLIEADKHVFSCYRK